MPVRNAATIIKLPVPDPHTTLLHMVQHVADWVAPFPCSRHFSPHPLKVYHTPPSRPSLRARELRILINRFNTIIYIHIIVINTYVMNKVN